MCLPTHKPRNARKPRATLAVRNARVKKQPRRALVTSRVAVAKPALEIKRAPLLPVSQLSMDLRAMAETRQLTASCSTSPPRSDRTSTHDADDLIDLLCTETMWGHDDAEATPNEPRRCVQLHRLAQRGDDCDDMSGVLLELEAEAALHYALSGAQVAFECYRERLDGKYVLSKARRLKVRAARKVKGQLATFAQGAAAD
jgi:hypothetical protein